MSTNSASTHAAEPIQSRLAERHRTIIIIAIALALAAAPRLMVFPLSVVHWDESIYTLVARDLTWGIMPLSGAFEHKPVFLYYVFAIPQLLFGDTIAATRFLSIALAAIGAFLAATFVRKALSDDMIVVSAAAALYALWSALNRGLAPQPEAIMNIFVLLALIVSHDRFQSTAPRRVLRAEILLGAIWAAAIQTNYLSAILLVAFTLDYWLLMLRGKTFSDAVGAYVKSGLIIFASFAAAFFLLLSPVFLFGDIGLYIDLQLKFLMGYAGDGSFLRTLVDIPKVMRPFALMVAFGVCFGGFFLWSRARKATFFGDEPVATRALIYFAAALFACVAANRAYAKYFLLLLPSIVVLTSIFLAQLSKHGSLRAFAALSLAVYSTTLIEEDRYLLRQGLSGYARILKGRPADVTHKIAGLIKQDLSEGDTIYVYDYQPILYYLTRVRPPTRFASSIHHLEHGYVEAMELDRTQTMHDILAKAPKFIVTGTNPTDGRYEESSAILAAAIASDYEIALSIEDKIFTTTLSRNEPGDHVNVYRRRQ